MATITATEPIDVLTAMATVGPLIFDDDDDGFGFGFGVGVVDECDGDGDVDVGLDRRLRLRRRLKLGLGLGLGLRLVLAESMMMTSTTEEEEKAGEMVRSRASVAEFVGGRDEGDADAVEIGGFKVTVTEEAKLLGMDVMAAAEPPSRVVEPPTAVDTDAAAAEASRTLAAAATVAVAAPPPPHSQSPTILSKICSYISVPHLSRMHCFSRLAVSVEPFVKSQRQGFSLKAHRIVVGMQYFWESKKKGKGEGRGKLVLDGWLVG